MSGRLLRLAAVALACTIAGLGTRTARAAEEQPLGISADNMTGSHGPEGDIVTLTGHVRITRGTTVLTAERGIYEKARGTLHLEGRVKMVDSTTTVTCDNATYVQDTDIIQLEGNVTAVDRDATLQAPSATYDRRKGRADLYGGVQARQEAQRLRSDRAAYFRDSLLLQARGHVVGIDEKNKLELNADSLDYDRGTHVAVATGNPSLKGKDEEGREAVIHALKLRVNTETRLAEAIDSVHIERDTLQARADYGRFEGKLDRGWLVGHPRAWDDQTTLTGDTLAIVTHERELERLEVRGNPMVEYTGSHPDTKGELSRLSGERIDVFFAEQDIDSLVAIGKAKDEYQAMAREGKTAEQNTAQGDTITVYFEKRKIARARVQGNASGEYRPPVAVADTASAASDIVQYDAKTIDYILGHNRIVLDPDAHLLYRDLELKAGRVEYDIEGQSLVANGNPELVEHGDKVTGHLMTYDLETRVGNIYKADTEYEKGLYHGSQIRKVSEKELDVMNGEYSTCHLADPHYHFSARWMKIYLKDKLVAKPVVFYVKHVPLLPLPFWIFPIKPGRHSGILLPQFVIGYNNAAGQFLRNVGYYWAPNDYFDITTAADYYQAQPSWVLRMEGQYKLLYVLDGYFSGSYARNDDPLAKSENWDINANHAQELSPRTRLTARAQYVSSREYNSSDLYGRSLAQRLNRFMTSSIAVSHTADWASWNAFVERREDLDADQSIGATVGSEASLPNLTENLPNISVALPTRALGTLPFLRETALRKGLEKLYFGLDARYVSYRERRGFLASYAPVFEGDSVVDSTRVFGQDDVTRRGFQTNASFTDSRRLLGWLNLQPSVFLNGAIFDHDELGNEVVPTGTWSASVALGTTVYGTFHPNIGPLKGIRHIITPRVSMAYSPEFPNLTYTTVENGQTVVKERFESFQGIGVSGFEQANMNFGVEQRFQVKYGRGEKIQKLDNLLSWTMASSYNFLYKERNQPHPLTPISSVVLLQPPGLLNASLNWTTDVYSPRPVRTVAYNLGFDLASRAKEGNAAPDLPVDETRYELDVSPSTEAWNLGLAYSYAGGYQGDAWSSSQTANAVVHYQLSPGWGVDYSASYDVTFREIGVQRFAITRDLHCWQMIFTRTFAPGGEAEYYFRLGVKDQRELFIERGTRTGSIGGIQ